VKHFRRLLRIKYSTEYEGVSICFQPGRVERELQTVQLSATRCSCRSYKECVMLLMHSLLNMWNKQCWIT